MMMKRVCVAAVCAAILGGVGVWAWPQEAQCTDCPEYNSRCISDVNCGYNCGMSCVRVEGDFRKRCR